MNQENSQQILLISETAKKVEVETHVLRYWEEELKLPIKRNEMGHRYYTTEDVKRFQEIKRMKEQGLQLKAIRTIIQKGDMAIEGVSSKEMLTELVTDERKKEENTDITFGKREKAEKAARLQYLLQHMMSEAVKSANEEMVAQIKESIIKELDYQFRTREEKEEERWKQEEEHFRTIDEMLREKSGLRGRSGKNRKIIKGEKRESKWEKKLKKTPSL